uniref:hypothetical protein n=1 Tax=uncultured Christiangramia sp. TaxID=503836 RepID=UPI00261E8F63
QICCLKFIENGLFLILEYGYRQLAECGTRICRLSIGLLVKLIIFFLALPLIGDEPLLLQVCYYEIDVV